MVDYWEGEESDDAEMEFGEVVDGDKEKEEEDIAEELRETEREVSEETSTAPAEAEMEAEMKAEMKTEMETEAEENEKPHTPLTPEEMRMKRLEFLERCNSANRKPQDEEN